MRRESLIRCFSFGFTQQAEGRIGQFGFGFQAGCLSAGRSVLVSTLCADGSGPEELNVGLLSLKHMLEEELPCIAFPLLTWRKSATGEWRLLESPEDKPDQVFYSCEVLTTYSPYDSEAKLLAAALEVLGGAPGTSVEIFHLSDSFELTADDVRLCDTATTHMPESNCAILPLDRSYRAYLQLLYLRPAIAITLCGNPVKHYDLLAALEKRETRQYRNEKTKSRVAMTFGLNRGVLVTGACWYQYNRLHVPFAPLRISSLLLESLKASLVVIVDLPQPFKASANKQGFTFSEARTQVERHLIKHADEYLLSAAEHDNCLDTAAAQKQAAVAAEHEAFRRELDLRAAVDLDGRPVVRCDRCGKFRFISQAVFDQLNLQPFEEDWFCEANEDVNYAACQAPQEAPRSDEDDDDDDDEEEEVVVVTDAADGEWTPEQRQRRRCRQRDEGEDPEKERLQRRPHERVELPEALREEVDRLGGEGAYMLRRFGRNGKSFWYTYHTRDGKVLQSPRELKRHLHSLTGDGGGGGGGEGGGDAHRSSPLRASTQPEAGAGPSPLPQPSKGKSKRRSTNEEGEEERSPRKRTRRVESSKNMSSASEARKEATVRALLRQGERAHAAERSALEKQRKALEKREALLKLQPQREMARSARLRAACAAPGSVQERVCVGFCAMLARDAEHDSVVYCGACDMAFHAECLGYTQAEVEDDGFVLECIDHQRDTVQARERRKALLLATGHAAGGPAPSASGATPSAVELLGGFAKLAGPPPRAGTAEAREVVSKPLNWPSSVRYIGRNVYTLPGPEDTLSRVWLLQRLNERRTPLPGLQIQILHPYHKLYDINQPDNRGLFANEVIEEGQWLGQYAGHARQMASTDGRSRFVMRMPSGFHAWRQKMEGASTYDEHVVDALHAGNELRFINDYRGITTEPNVTYEVTVARNGCLGSDDGATGGFTDELVMGVKALCRIEKGQEILAHYGADYPLGPTEV